MAIQFSSPLVSSGYPLKSFGEGRAHAAAAEEAAPRALSKLQDKALESLAREIPGMSSTDLRALDASDYTPEKVARRIGDFVQMGLESARARGKSEEDIQALYESAVKGVEKGFKEAKEILSNLKMLDGAIGEQVEATEKATFDALAAVSPARRQASPEVSTTSFALTERYRRAEDLELSVKTQEGDLVRISFSRSLDARSGVAAAVGSSGSRAAVLDVSRSDSTGYAFSVQGELSDVELDAIQRLVRDVGQVAHDFFGGDVQKAFDEVSEVSFDGSQLASMSLTMSRVEQYSMAQRYQETQQMDSPSRGGPGRRLGHLMQDLADSFGKSGLGFLSRPSDLASQIMRQLVEQDGRFQSAGPSGQDEYRRSLERLLGAVNPQSSV